MILAGTERTYQNLVTCKFSAEYLKSRDRNGYRKYICMGKKQLLQQPRSYCSLCYPSLRSEREPGNEVALTIATQSRLSGFP